MLYTVYATTGALTSDISSDIYEPKLSQKINSIDRFTFRVNPNIDIDITVMKTVVELKKSNDTIFKGRILQSVPSMTADGEVYAEITCEGLAGYLQDSVQPYREETLYEDTETQSGLASFISTLLTAHNAQVEQSKAINLGVVNVSTNSTNNQVYKGTNWQSTWDVIQDKLVKVYGGELRIREDSGAMYLDYMEEIGAHCSTTIDACRNQRSLKSVLDPSEVITRLYPLGSKVVKTIVEIETETDEDGNEVQVEKTTEKESEERLTIKDATESGGLTYIENETAVALYGIKCGTVTWDDITDPENLYKAAVNYLTEQNTAAASHSIDAVDLSFLGLDANEIELGNWYTVTNTVLGINTELEVVGLTVDLSQPWCPTVTLGEKSVALNDIVAGGLTTAAKAEIDDAIKSSYTVTNNILSKVQATVQETDKSVSVIVGNNNKMMRAFTDSGDELSLLFDKIVVTTDASGETRERATAYIRFIDGNIVLGKEGNPVTMTLKNDRLSFSQNGKEVAYLSKNKLYVLDGDFLNSLQIGRFAFLPRENGNLSFVRVGA